MDAAPDDVVCLPPGVIRPIHEPRDPELFAGILSSMREQGWLGRPLLVVPGTAGVYQALTGSHRLAAALEAGLGTVPAIVLPDDVAEKVRASRYFPKAPPFIAQDLFEAGEGWVGRFILMDQWLSGHKKPWSKSSLEHLRSLGHEDMIEVMSVRKWPCLE
jgi:hypothetical protein